MIVKSILIILVATCFAVDLSHGQNPGKKLQRADALLVEAYTQRILPGRRESRIIKETHFIVIWQNKNYPKSFIWLDDSGTMNCNIAKAHKANIDNRRRLSGRPGYYSENIALEKIQKGDTLDISPVNTGTAPLPSGISKNRRNILIYTIGNGKAPHVLQVGSITKKQDIAMP